MNRRRGVVVALLAVLVAATALLGNGLAGGSTTPTPPMVGKQAPALAGETLDGRRFALNTADAGLTVVNVWASWCAPCRDELPLLAARAETWRPKDVRLVTVNTQDGPDAARSLLQELGVRSLLTVLDPDGDIAVDWGAKGVPETYVVDSGGTIRARRMGEVTDAWLDEQVERWGAS